MATLEAIQLKIEKLQAQAEAIAAKRASATLDRIRDLMEKHGVTLADIEAHIGQKKRSSMRSTAIATRAETSAAKYQNPKNGATWSGRGRAPAWIANVKDRSRFLVDANASSASQVTASKGKKRGNYVRGPQPLKYRDPKTGATWSGRGRAPAWLKDLRNRSKFLIASGEAAIAASVGAVSEAKSAAKKASTVSSAAAHKGQRKGPQPAKYRDPKSGATWSGRGPAPAWLAAAKDRSRFLINAAGAVEADAAVASKTKPATKKAGARKVTAKTVKAGKVPTAKKAAAKNAGATAAAPKSAAPEKVAGGGAVPTVKKMAAKKAPATKAVVASKVVAKADVAATPDGVTAQETA